MNLRVFKKDIKFHVEVFVNDCTAFISKNPDKVTEELSKIIEDAANLYYDTKEKASDRVEGNRKLYFNGLLDELFEKLDALYERLSKEIIRIKA